MVTGSRTIGEGMLTVSASTPGGAIVNRESVLARTMVELADNLVDDFDIVDLLTTLSDRCVDVLDVAAAGIMLATPSGDLQLITASSEAMRVVELFELQTEQGPCLDSFHSRQPVVNQDLTEAGDRWPQFAPVAVRQGFRSADAIPMRLRGEIIGALNLFRTETGSLKPMTSSPHKPSLTSRPSPSCKTATRWRPRTSTHSSRTRSRAASSSSKPRA